MVGGVTLRLGCCVRFECEKRLRQEAEDKHCQIVDKLGFDARMHDQVVVNPFILPSSLD